MSPQPRTKGSEEVISTDVLVIGGGIAGLCAAVRAKENGADVLAVDKGGIGWAGQVPISGGHIAIIRPERVQEFFEFTVRDGEFLNNQDWSYQFSKESYKSLMDLNGLNFPFTKTGDTPTILTRQQYFDHVRFNPARSLINLKASALSKGVKTLDKVYMIDLLRRDGKVAGAIGFGLADNKTYVFHAKAVIIANGSCRYKRQKLFVANAGEGPAMAYRAGAQLTNAEFANTYGYEIKVVGMYHRHPMYLFFENARGENIIAKHYPQVLVGREPGKEYQDFWQITDAMAKEVEAGLGPIYLNLGKLSPEERNIAKGGTVAAEIRSQMGAQLRAELFRLLETKAGIDPDKGKIEVQPMFVGAQGPIRIDLNCRTTLDGLWAVGDASSLGSGWTGARASGTHPGGSIGFAVVSGFKAGQSAAEFATTTQKQKVTAAEVKMAKKRIFAPLGRAGDVGVRDVMYQTHEAIVPIKYNFHRERGRLKEALVIVETAKQNLARVGAKDHHELSKYHQAESIALAAEWVVRSSLLREESRGTHQREDFPRKDDKNWLKWVVIQDRSGSVQLSTEPVPIEKYRLKP